MGHYKNNVTDLKFPKTDFDNSYPLLPNLGQLEGSIEDLFDADNIPHS